MDNYVGKRLDGRYEVQEIIGVGGMSVVYKAYDNVDDRIVAVKILKEEFAANEEFKRRFKNESKAIALLSHPNIVKVYDVNFGEKLQYIVMEYIDGITLKEYINKQGAITWNDALFFMTQILKAVQHAHDKGIVHRDIKPQNIILLSTGDIKVTDFGIARFSRSDTKTLTEQAIGSVHYIAPEQAKGEFTDEKADIYSLGVVLYEMLAGSVPFEADSAVSVALMQLQADAKRLTDINSDIPVGLDQICNHAMQKNPLDRYQTATEMLLDIEEIIKNPKVTFNYTAKIDANPTRVVSKSQINNYVRPAEPEIEDDDYSDPDRKKKIITASVIGLILLAAATVLLVMFFTNNVNKTSVKLPNFVGTSYDEILNSNAYDFEFVQETEKTDSQQSGIVLSQKPEAGTKVQKGSTVTLVVAISPDDITVPNLYNLTEVQAKKKLEQSKLMNYKVMTKPNESVEDGKVINTEPKADTVVGTDTEITIYISSGPSTTVLKTITVPDVYGLSQSGARAFLKKYGFTNVSFVTQDSPVAKDTVISQQPAAGTPAKEDEAIKVVISSGVTTTTTEKQNQVSFTVKLPTCIDEKGNYVKDSLIVKIDGKTYLSRTVTLNGGTEKFSSVGEQGKSQTITASLKSVGATESVTTNGKGDEKKTIDFSGSSYNNKPEESTDENSDN
ncbi:MAG: Stk1 family PASTA domain-containing Ser/Thr kinase [Ruminococcaceae bacterium]|nr:Stk1 family PASTA domain-containing Ser/Thr kinase [Oscillospiraceae bacterium]